MEMLTRKKTNLKNAFLGPSSGKLKLSIAFSHGS